MDDGNRLACGVCQKKFASVSTKNRHLKTVHNSKVEEKKSQHIRCPLCPEEKKEALGNHDILINHLTQVHSVSIKQCNLTFSNIEEFENWRSKENREVDYACHRRKKSLNGDQYVYYNCNRSDSYEFHSNCTKRAMKTGGSIRISGICPARILVKVFENGIVDVKFIETHVGHRDELRTKRLMKKEQDVIVEQLHAGVTNERILQDARKIKDNHLERINLITRGDLTYLIRKFNIDKKRDSEETLHVEEPTTSKLRYEDELCQYLEEKRKNNNEASKSVNFETSQQIVSEEIYNYIKNIDEESFKKFVGMFRTFKNNLEQDKTNEVCKKRKIEKQTYFPNKK